MPRQLDTLFELLPAIYRLKDHQLGQAARLRHGDGHPLEDTGDYGPLRSLLSALVREGQIVHEDIQQLYDDNFIETCAPWVIPYIGDLVGARALEDIGDAQSARQQIASTLALRQRKGTMAALEYAIRTATGWPVIGVEYWARIATTESLRRVRVTPGGTANLSDPIALDKVNTAFDKTPRSAEFGRVETGHGLWNLPNIGLHLHRLHVLEHGAPTADSLGDLVKPAKASLGQYRFGQLGADQPIYQRPALQDLALDQRPDETDMPMPISRWMLLEDVQRFDDPAAALATSRFVGKSFDIHVLTAAGKATATPRDLIVADLSNKPGSDEDWQYTRHAEKILIDPELGRFILPSGGDFANPTSVHVRWHYARAHGAGGHEGARDITPTAAPVLLESTTRLSIDDLTSAAFAGVQSNTFAGNMTTLVLDAATDGIIASEGACPTIDCENRRLRIITAQPGIVLSGLRLVRCRGLFVEFPTEEDEDAPEGAPSVIVEDCLLSSKSRFTFDGHPLGLAFVIWSADRQAWTIRRSITHGILTRNDTVLDIEDSILIAQTPRHAVIHPFAASTGDLLSLRRCTVQGRIKCHALSGGSRMDTGPYTVSGEVSEDPAGIEDSVIIAERASLNHPPVDVAVTQRGCVRYSHIPLGSKVPRRFACTPALTDDPLFVRPAFHDVRLPHPRFFQMHFDTPAPIFSGAQDGQEMGVGNALRTTARRINFTRVTDDFLRFGHAAGPRYET